MYFSILTIYCLNKSNIQSMASFSNLPYKQSPFQKPNPFPAQHSYSRQNLTNNYPNAKSTVTTGRYHTENNPILQENNYLKNSKADSQYWKFHEDNCNRNKVFLHNSSTVNEKYRLQKNGFHKEILLGKSSVTSRHKDIPQNPNYQNRQKIENPFNRKYLVGGAQQIAESKVYVPSSIRQSKNNLERVQSYTKLTYDQGPASYTNYTPENIAENYIEKYSRVQTYEPISNADIYGIINSYVSYGQQSRKSIERKDDSPQRNSIRLYQGQSRNSLEKQKEDWRVGSYKYMGNSRQRYGYEGSRKSLERTPIESKVIFTEKGSDDQETPRIRREESLHKVVYSPSKQETQFQEAAPRQVRINGKTFFKQQLQFY